MSQSRKIKLLLLALFLPFSVIGEGLPLFYWNEDSTVNFGDYLSRLLVERIVNEPLKCYIKKSKKQKKNSLQSDRSFISPPPMM